MYVNSVGILSDPSKTMSDIFNTRNYYKRSFSILLFRNTKTDTIILYDKFGEWHELDGTNTFKQIDKYKEPLYKYLEVINFPEGVSVTEHSAVTTALEKFLGNKNIKLQPLLEDSREHIRYVFNVIKENYCVIVFETKKVLFKNSLRGEWGYSDATLNSNYSLNSINFLLLTNQAVKLPFTELEKMNIVDSVIDVPNAEFVDLLPKIRRVSKFFNSLNASLFNNIQFIGNPEDYIVETLVVFDQSFYYPLRDLLETNTLNFNNVKGIQSKNLRDFADYKLLDYSELSVIITSRFSGYTYTNLLLLNITLGSKELDFDRSSSSFLRTNFITDLVEYNRSKIQDITVGVRGHIYETVMGLPPFVSPILDNPNMSTKMLDLLFETGQVDFIELRKTATVGKRVKYSLYNGGKLMEPTNDLDEELKRVLLDNMEKTRKLNNDATSAWGTTKNGLTFNEYLGINGDVTTAVESPIARVDELINIVLSYIQVQPDVYHKPKHIRKKPAKNDKFIKIGSELLDPANTILEIEDILTDANTVVSKGSQTVFNIADIVPILPVQVLSAKVGDIASVSIRQGTQWVYTTLVLKDSTLIETLLELHNEYFNTVIIRVYRNTDFKDKAVIKRTIKRYSCGHLVDANTGHDILPEDLDNNYIDFQDVHQTFELEAIRHHYNLPELKNISDNIMKELELWLDHPINTAVREWVMLLGESGSGKTSVAFAYAKKKKLDVIKMPGSMQVSVEDLLGYKSVTTGEYIPSLLRDAVENGKVFIFDEIDACNPNTLLCLNGLKDDYFYFPDGAIKVHENFRFIATANTLEHSEKFSARAPLDAATQKRFKIIKYNLHESDLAVRYGLKYMKQIKKERGEDARDLERKIRELKIKELLEKEG